MYWNILVWLRIEISDGFLHQISENFKIDDLVTGGTINLQLTQWLTMFRRRFNPSQSIVLLIPNIVKHRLHVCWTPNGGGNYPITRHNLLKDCGKNKWETISMLKHFYAKHTRLITGWKWEVSFADPAHGLVNRIRYSSGARSKMKWSKC